MCLNMQERASQEVIEGHSVVAIDAPAILSLSVQLYISCKSLLPMNHWLVGQG